MICFLSEFAEQQRAGLVDIAEMNLIGLICHESRLSPTASHHNFPSN